jgi:hypothetical protein
MGVILTNEQDESVLWTGIAHWDGNHLLMLRKDPDKPFEISNEWHSRIQPTPEASKEDLLGAEFFLRLSVGNIPVGSDEAEFQKTGLKWPK